MNPENMIDNRSVVRKPFKWHELQSIISADELHKLARSEKQEQTYRRARSQVRLNPVVSVVLIVIDFMQNFHGLINIFIYIAIALFTIFNVCMQSCLQIKDEWESIYDYILCSKFQFLVDDDRGRKKRSKPTFEEWQSMQKSESNSQIIVLSLNDFPYYFEEGILHYVLWKLGGVVTAVEIENGKKEILQKAGKAGCANNDVIELIKDSSIFLHWLNPPELKSLPDVDHVHILFRRPAMCQSSVLVSC